MKTLLTLLVFLGPLGLIDNGTAEKTNEASLALTSDSLALVPKGAAVEMVAIRELTLKEGVDPEVFKKFVVEELGASFNQYVPGAKFLIMKGERGKNIGKYVCVIVFDSIHTRNLYWPEPDKPPSKVWEAILAASGGAIDRNLEKVGNYVAGFDQYTDYVSIER